MHCKYDFVWHDFYELEISQYCKPLKCTMVGICLDIAPNPTNLISPFKSPTKSQTFILTVPETHAFGIHQIGLLFILNNTKIWYQK